MRSAAGRVAKVIGVLPLELTGHRHGYLVHMAVRSLLGTGMAFDPPQDPHGQEPMTGAALFWIVLSIAGLVVETILIIFLGCRITQRDEPAGRSAAPPEPPRVPR